MIDFQSPLRFMGLIRTLERLNVSNNRITDVGAQFVANFISKSKKIDTLQINWNKIMGRGSMYLSKALNANGTLKVLDCSFNSFGSDCNTKIWVRDRIEK